MIWAFPPASSEQLAAFYQNYYDERHMRGTKEWTRRWKVDLDSGQVAIEASELHATAARLFAAIPPNLTGLRWLEVGAGLGQFSYLAKRQGFEVTITDLDYDALNFASSELGINETFQGDLEAAALASGSYDVVVIHHVLEHVGDLKGTLAEIHRLLRPGGFLFVGVPNLASSGYLGYRALSFLRFRIPGIVDGVEHTLGFNMRTLAMSLGNAGFDVKRIEARGKGLPLSQALSYLRAFGPYRTSIHVAEAVFHTKIECIATKTLVSTEPTVAETRSAELR